MLVDGGVYIEVWIPHHLQPAVQRQPLPRPMVRRTVDERADGLVAVVAIVSLYDVRVLEHSFGPIFRPANVQPVLHFLPGEHHPFVDVGLLGIVCARLLAHGHAGHAAKLDVDVRRKRDVVRRKRVIQVRQKDDVFLRPAFLNLGCKPGDERADDARCCPGFSCLGVPEFLTVGAVTIDVLIVW